MKKIIDFETLPPYKTEGSVSALNNLFEKTNGINPAYISLTRNFFGILDFVIC